MKKYLLLLLGTLLVGTLSGCDTIRRSHFMKMCAATASDEPVCKCVFKVVDQQLSPTYGKTWIYRPDLAELPLFSRAMYQAERQCSHSYFKD